MSAEVDLDLCKYTAPLAAGLPFFGAKAPVQGEVKIHTKGNRASSSLLPSSSYKPDTKNKTKTSIKEIYKPISLLNTDANILN